MAIDDKTILAQKISQLRALVEIAKYPDSSLVKEAIAHGQFENVSLLSAQQTLLQELAEDLPDLGKGLFTNRYTPEIFSELMGRFRSARVANKTLAVDLVEQAVIKNDLNVLHHFPGTLPSERSPEPIPQAPSSPPPLPQGSSTPREEHSPETRPPSNRQAQRRQQQGEVKHQERSESPASQPQDENEEFEDSEQRGETQQQDQGNQTRPQRTPPPSPTPPKSEGDQTPHSPPRPSQSLRQKLDEKRKKALSLFRKPTGQTGGLLNSLAQHVVNRWLGNLARSALRAAGQLGRMAVNAIARGAINLASRLGVQAALAAGRVALIAVAANPFTWLIVGVSIIIGVTMWWAGEMDKAANSECGQAGTINILKEVKNPKESFAVGENIEYEIIAVFNLRCVKAMANVEIRDVLPPNTKYVSSSSKINSFPADYKAPDTAQSQIESQGVQQGNAVVWKLNNMLPERGAILSLVITPNDAANNTWLVNEVTARHTTISPVGSTTSAGLQPTQDNCGGKYTLADRFGTKNPLGNFGDPQCNMDKDQLYTLLQQNDPTNARFWFTQVIPCESSYNPNTWRDPNLEPKTPDPAGAWGLFQMGRGRNGPSDRGDVEWQDQTINAIAYSKKISSLGAYWACARVDVQGGDN